MRSAVNKRIKEPFEEHNGFTILKTLEDFDGMLRKIKKAYIYENHMKYLKVPAGFDIETTRVDTRAYMYHWQVSFGQYILCGRKWADFAALVDRLNTWLNWQKCCLIVWVANLGHEFSFICSRFKWANIFAVATHEPLKARTGRIEFRECLSISGAGGLANLSKHYTAVKKAVNDLDYTKPRNSQSSLTETERGYCYTDVEILSQWGTYIFENFCDLGLQIPLTATGIVRSHIKKAAEDTGRFEDIKNIIWALYPKTAEEYNFIMTFLFRGGYTHACVYWCNIPWAGVIGADFTSSYPAVMLHCDNYQVSPFKRTELETDGKMIIDKRMQQCCVWFVATFYGVEQTTRHAIESKHKLCEEENAFFDNGRLIAADKIQVALTEMDYKVYCKFYKWKQIEIQAAFVAAKGKLPEYLLKPLRHFYKIKARLKKAGHDNTIEYQNAKSICNSFYGCCVTRLKFLEAKYNENTHKWYEEEQQKPFDELRKNQLLSPFWGIQITSNARAALLLGAVWGIDGYEEGQEPPAPSVLYCDTDSAYFIDTPENRAVIEKYNAEMFKVNEAYEPEFYDIGAFDWIDKRKDGSPVQYLFKTLGAKRYVKYHDGIASVTVAGLPKRALEKMLVRPFAPPDGESYILYEKPKEKKGRLGFVSVNELFDAFNDHMLLSVEWSMKTRAAYNPDYTEDIVTDEEGHTETMSELSSVAIVPTHFQMKLEPHYKALIERILKERRIEV